MRLRIFVIMNLEGSIDSSLLMADAGVKPTALVRRFLASVGAVVIRDTGHIC